LLLFGPCSRLAKTTDAAGQWAPAARRSRVRPGDAREGKLQTQPWTWLSSLVKGMEKKLKENRDARLFPVFCQSDVFRLESGFSD